MSVVILIRGNSGSGKTTVAKEIHHLLGPVTLYISQDVVRREMLKVKDKPNNLAIGLIEQILDYGMRHCDFVILEGILSENKYGDMLRNTLKQADKVFAYYYDLSFEETLRRHQTKGNTDFGEKEMRSWFTPHDTIGLENESIVDDNMTKEDMIQRIMEDLKLYKQN
ncbi:kinase [Staphylococcus auricularis]|uniref:kinase n=1 Tax=Staphylococcus auricularis TaxID=29379 RepID=UPI003EBB898B